MTQQLQDHELLARREHISGTEEAWHTYRAVRHFQNLDGLRFLAISMVLWHHSQPYRHPDLPILDRGFLGVDFFFVLSGYLITTLLLREAARKGSFSLRGFYMRRILRIIPVYFFVVTAIGGYYIFIAGRTEFLELWPYYYLFLANFLIEDIPLLSPTWSLSVEEQYYMLWPLLLMLLRPRWLVPVICVLVALNVLGSTGFFGIDPLAWGPLLFQLPNSTYAPILLGSLAAILLHRQDTFAVLYRLTGWTMAPVTLLLTMLLTIQLIPRGDIQGLPNLVIHTTMTLTLISLVVRENTILTPILTWAPIQRIGIISYGIYLYHLLARDLTYRGLTHFDIRTDWLEFCLYFALSALIAEVSFRTLEAYFQSFRSDWKRKG